MNYCSKCRMIQIQEDYVQPVTVSYPEWVRTITDGNTRPFVDAVYPSGTVGDGAVLAGHVRQNVMTAGLPYTPLEDSIPDVPVWNS